MCGMGGDSGLPHGVPGAAARDHARAVRRRAAARRARARHARQPRADWTPRVSEPLYILMFV